MSDTSPAPLPAQRFTLNAMPPVRPLAIGAGTVVLGAVLLVLWRSAELPAVVGVLGGIVMVLGVALAIAALVLTARLRTEVHLDRTSLTVVRNRERRSVPWDQVEEVTVSHPRLTVTTTKPGQGVLVVNPRKPDDPVFAALLQQIQQRLDHDRGYRPLE